MNENTVTFVKEPYNYEKRKVVYEGIRKVLSDAQFKNTDIVNIINLIATNKLPNVKITY
jgi:hypothetical protein